jgi:hypothetical protein
VGACVSAGLLAPQARRPNIMAKTSSMDRIFFIVLPPKYKKDQPVSATPEAQPKAAPDHGVWKEARPPLCKLWKSVNFTKTDQSISDTISHLNK